MMNVQNPNNDGNFTAPSRSVWATSAWILGGFVLLAILIGWFNRDGDTTTIGDGTTKNESYQANDGSSQGTEAMTNSSIDGAGTVGSLIFIGATSADGAANAEEGLKDLDERMGQRVKVQARVSKVYENSVFAVKSDNTLLDHETLVILQMDNMPVLREGMQVVVEGVVRKLAASSATSMISAQTARDEVMKDYEDESVIFISQNLNN